VGQKGVSATVVWGKGSSKSQRRERSQTGPKEIAQEGRKQASQKFQQGKGKRSKKVLATTKFHKRHAKNTVEEDQEVPGDEKPFQNILQWRAQNARDERGYSDEASEKG